jgi:hypothetical protein
VPVIVTDVATFLGAVLGTTVAMVGLVGTVYIYGRLESVKPPGPVNTTVATLGAATCGVTNVRLVAVADVGVVETVPSAIDVTCARCWPVTVTVVPPAIGPDQGLRSVNIGALNITSSTYQPGNGEPVPVPVESLV